MPHSGQQNIHCIVSDCHYWNQGNKCHADQILVANDAFGSMQPDQVDVNTASQLTPGTAGFLHGHLLQNLCNQRF
ncbi:MAG: DUF1540 domain-containing protein [Candidatus Syntrophopropionicum ammoniitolerans]